jgi:hypothetical protein
LGETSTATRHGTHFFFFFFLSGACVRADAAALFAAFEDLGLRNTFPAADAAFLPVRSFLAIDFS